MSAKVAREARPAAATSAHVLTPAPARRLQRRCACGGTPTASGECEECRRKRLQRSAAGPKATAVPPIVDRVLGSPGAPLDGATRGFMESRFGHDFSRVRVHDDAAAAESARAVHAHAYTVGEDVVFAAGKHDPGSAAGLHLLAHELAHTVQQRGLQRSAADLSQGGPLEPQLEREAESAARAVMQGGAPAGMVATATPGPRLSRAAEATDYKWEDQLMTPALERLGVTARALAADGAQAFKIAQLDLPAEKGDVASIWQKRAGAKQLRAFVDKDGSIKEKTVPSTEKRERWLAKVGWGQDPDPAKRWADTVKSVLGKDLKDQSTGEFTPRVPDGKGLKTCDLDHIIELQFGGENIVENFQVLDLGLNRSSGSQIRQYLEKTADDIRNATKHKDTVILVVAKVSKPTPASGPCSKIENFVRPEGGGSTKGGKETAEEGLEGEAYDLVAAARTTLDLPKGSLLRKKTPPIALKDSDNVHNRAGASLVPGLWLHSLRLGATEAKDQVDASFDPTYRHPFTVDEKASFALSVLPGSRKLKAPPKLKAGFFYKGLSEGVITALDFDATTGLSGSGTLTPSTPLLSNLKLGIEFGPDRLAVTVGLEPEALKKLTPPIPGARIENPTLTLELYPELKPEGSFKFSYGPKGKPLLDAMLTFGKDSQGLTVDGVPLNAHLPGADKAEGEVHYRGGVWTGGARVEASKLGIPFAKSGEVAVRFDPGGLEAEGNVLLELPLAGKTSAVRLILQRTKDGRWLYTGSGEFEVPKFEKVSLKVTYDGTVLSGEGRAPFKRLAGLTGDLAFAYSAKPGEPGRVSGTGTITVKKNRATGSLTIKLSPAGKLSGSGSISFKVSEKLEPKAEIEIDDNEKVRFKGALVFPEPIPLFKPIAGDKELFKAGITIPIPGVSVGPVGLVVKIDGRLVASYAIGPGELRNARIEAAFNPLEDKPDLDAQIGATLYVGASAGIHGSIRGAIAIDVKIASLSGGLTVGASADLQGKLEAAVLFHYQKSRFDLKADSELSAGLTLGLTLAADVRAEAGIGPFSVETTKVWHLASYKYDTGLKFGMKAKLYYASDQPFKPPSIDEIEWIKPDLKVGDMLEKILRGATAKEEKK